MKKEYDFSEARRNPYAKMLKRQVTIRLDQATIAYFKALAEDVGIPYQTLIAADPVRLDTLLGGMKGVKETRWNGGRGTGPGSGSGARA